MKYNTSSGKTRRFAWHSMLFSLLYLTLAFTTFDIFAKENTAKLINQPAFSALSASQQLRRQIVGQDIDCDGDEACEFIQEICEDRELCRELLRICIEDPEWCIEIIGPPEECDEEDCEDFTEECEDGQEEDCEDFSDECEEGNEEDCEDFTEECEEGQEEDCEDFTEECEEGNEEDCEDFSEECEEGQEEDCEDFTDECEEGQEEDCEDFSDECEEGQEEDCEDFSDECEEGQEEDCEDFSDECEDGQEEDCEDFTDECEDGQEEDCEDFSDECEEGQEEDCEDFMDECEEGQEEDCEDFSDECEEGQEEDCEENTVEQPSGFVNPNPAADRTVMTVDKDAANDASRFLSQATLGANYATITQVAATGPDMWLEQQFELPPSYTLPFAEFLMAEVEKFYLANEDLSDEEFEVIFERLGDPERFWVDGWWTTVMTSPDVVRQRVAMALSEIFVVSSNVEEIGINNFAMAGYYDLLIKNSLGNFRDLLKDVTLSHTMGIYLSHIHNAKADPSKGTFPDENYAREVMQLFSIGLYELNPDGSRKLDASGDPIPTYGQDEIREFAKVFTGLSWNSDDPNAFGQRDVDELESDSDTNIFLLPMKMYEQHHDTSSKTLLRGQVVPAGQTGMQDINAAIDNLFNHPNVGPFIGKQLIQRLVKSNPSPAYIARVTAAFNGETGSARGDMKAVVRAILMDPEARQAPNLASSSDGRLREPFLRVAHLMRTFNATSSDNTYSDDGYEMAATIRQYVLSAPSVFNFFLPSYAPNGELKDAGLVAPEFQITNASTIMDIKNVIYYSLETGQVLDNSGALPAEKLDFSEEVALAADADALLDRLDTVMTYGTLTSGTREAIKTVIEAIEDHQERVAAAVYLLAISPDYAVAI